MLPENTIVGVFKLNPETGIRISWGANVPSGGQGFSIDILHRLRDQRFPDLGVDLIGFPVCQPGKSNP